VKGQLRNHIFRAWTACAVLAGYAYGWLYAPEMLTWWKRTTTTAIEAGCALLPYPWGDRIEATLGNFGLWVQITLAIVVFRILIWFVIVAATHLDRPQPCAAAIAAAPHDLLKILVKWPNRRPHHQTQDDQAPVWLRKSRSAPRAYAPYKTAICTTLPNLPTHAPLSRKPMPGSLLIRSLIRNAHDYGFARRFVTTAATG
jgi:hypothetical protein